MELNRHHFGHKLEPKYQGEKELTFKRYHPRGACFPCGKIGHYKRDCKELNGKKHYHPRGGGSSYKGRGSRLGNAGIDAHDTKSYLSLIANIMAGNEALKDKWILDLRATRHMTSDLSGLTTIRGTGASVDMKDVSLIPVENAGTVFLTAVVDGV